MVQYLTRVVISWVDDRRPAVVLPDEPLPNAVYSAAGTDELEDPPAPNEAKFKPELEFKGERPKMDGDVGELT
jgi:hypothetical protein